MAKSGYGTAHQSGSNSAHLHGRTIMFEGHAPAREGVEMRASAFDIIGDMLSKHKCESTNLSTPADPELFYIGKAPTSSIELAAHPTAWHSI